MSVSVMWDKQAPQPTGGSGEPKPLRGDGQVEEDKKQGGVEREEEQRVTSALFEPSTLPCRDSKAVESKEEMGSALPDKAKIPQKNGMEEDKGSLDSVTVHVGQESRTESERELRLKQKIVEDDWRMTEEERKLDFENGEKGRGLAVGEDDRESLKNVMPEKAAQVFVPNVTIVELCKQSQTHEDSDPLLAEERQSSPFLGSHGIPANGYCHDWPRQEQPSKCQGCGDRSVLKAGVAVFTAALIFPVLLWGGYVFLPFDAPLLSTAPERLVYTLRCSVFAVVPVVLGVLVLGVSRLWSSSVKPLCEGEAEPSDVAIHRHYVSDSISLFLLYFLQLAVMATYLSQKLLKLVPLLTIMFSLGRLIYWLSVGLGGSSARGIGFGMSFLPMLAMLAANLYFIFTLDAGGSIFALETQPTPESPQAPRQRFWG